MKSNSVVSAVITLHREGPLAHKTLLSIERCRVYAEQSGIETEFVITLDNADEETTRIAQNHPSLRSTDKIYPVNFRDPSVSRNFAIGKARGEFVGTFDGDDYFTKNWVERGVACMRNAGRKAIFHPEMMIAFGEWNAYWWQVDQSGEYYHPKALLTHNYWNTCAFSLRDTFLEIPYQAASLGESGFGYEDWLWNCDTIAAGYVHHIAQGTARYERRKSSGSVNIAHNQACVVLRPTPFFDEDILR